MNTDSTSENNPCSKLEPSLEKLLAFEKTIRLMKNALEQLALCDDLPMAAHCSFVQGGIRSILLHPDFSACEKLLRDSAFSASDPFNHESVIDAPEWSERLRGHLFFESHSALFPNYEGSRDGPHRNWKYVQALEELRAIASENRLVVKDGAPIRGSLSQVKFLTFVNIQQGWDILTGLVETLSVSITATQQIDSMLEYDEPWMTGGSDNTDNDDIWDGEMKEYWEKVHDGIEQNLREQEEERKQNTGSFLDHDPYVLEDNIGWDILDHEME